MVKKVRPPRTSKAKYKQLGGSKPAVRRTHLSGVRPFVNSWNPSKLSGAQKIIDNPYCKIDKSIDSITEISTEISKSGAKVYLVEYQSKKYMVKMFNVRGNIFEYNIKNEIEIYKIMTFLIQKAITPFVIGYIHSRECFPDKKKKDNKNYFLLTEAANNVRECLSLHDFLLKYKKKITPFVFTVLLSQIVYTLNCFAKINLIHMDLHINNILVYIYENNILNAEFAIEQYNLCELYKIYDIGLEIRIFDFDRSVKFESDVIYQEINYQSANTNKYLEKFETLKYKNPLEKLKTLYFPKIDLFKVVQELILIIFEEIIPSLEDSLNNAKNKNNYIECLNILLMLLNPVSIYNMQISTNKLNSTSPNNNITKHMKTKLKVFLDSNTVTGGFNNNLLYNYESEFLSGFEYYGKLCEKMESLLDSDKDSIVLGARYTYPVKISTLRNSLFVHLG